MAKVIPKGLAKELAGKEIPCCGVLRGHSDKVLCLAFDPEGQTLCSGGEDGELRLWRIVAGQWQCVKTLEVGSAVTACAFHPGAPNALLTGSGDNGVRVWRALRGECDKVMMGHGDRVTCVNFEPNGNRAVSGSLDGTAVLWMCTTGKSAKTLKMGDPVTCASFNPNGEIIVVGSQNRTLRGYNAHTYSKMFECEGHEAPVLCVAFHPRTEWFVSGASDRMIHVWRESDGVLCKELKGHRGNVHGCSFDASGQLMATTEGGGAKGRTNGVWLWDFVSGTRKHNIQECINTHVLRGHEGAVLACAFNPDSSILASCSEDSTVRLWKIRQGPVSTAAARDAVGESTRKGKSRASNTSTVASEAGAPDSDALRGVGKEFTGPWGPGPKSAFAAKSKAQLNREMGFTTGNAFKDWVNEVKDGFWEWGHDKSESGLQAHEVKGSRRINAGHQNVNGWCDDKPSRDEGEEPCKLQ